MRTRKSTVTFQSAFLLNRDVGELPAGRYDIEIDEEDVGTIERSAYRRTAVYLCVQTGASTRTVAATPMEFDLALERDQDPHASQ